MTNIFKRISLILCFVMLITLSVACDGGKPITESSEATEITENKAQETTIITDESDESERETETEESQPVKVEIVDDIITFADFTRSSRSYLDIKKDGDIAISFTIPEGQVKELYLNLTDIYQKTKCSFDVNIYAFDGRYDSSVASTPVYYEYITSTYRTYTIPFEDGQITEGDYLLVVSFVDPGEETTEDELHSKVIVENCWQPKTYPEEFKKYSLKSYINGKPHKKTAICGGFLVEKLVEVPDTEPVKEPNIFSENSAKVILLGGQSNATGSSLSSLLKNNVTDAEYEEYLNGYSNVKILYTSGSTSGGIHYKNVSDEFVDTKLGQGYSTGCFGPEVGLAAHLSETYPDETFYIIKYAIGGSGLQAHWNPMDETRERCLKEFKEKVDLGMTLIEEEGLDPQIVAFLWMQGESDASTLLSANKYYELQKLLVEDIRDEFAFYAPSRGIAFIDATISNSGVWASWYIVNDHKVNYALESDMNFCIDTNANGLTTLHENNDIAHYDSTSMILLGRLFGEELSKALE